MAISNDKLKDVFNHQKVANFDDLKFLKTKNTKLHPNRPFVKENNKKPVSDPLANRTQTVSKPLASDKDTVSDPLANRTQTVSKPLASDKDTVSDPLANRTQTVSKPLASDKGTVSDPLANRTLTVSKPLEKKPKITPLFNGDLYIFSEKELNLLDVLFKFSVKNNGEIICEIQTEILVNYMNLKPNRIRNLVHRISKKGGIDIKKFKSGRIATRKFLIARNLYTELQKRNSEILNSPIYNNNDYYYLNKKTDINIGHDEKETLEKEMTSDWHHVDFSSLLPFGFKKSHLDQIQKFNTITAEEVQDSINHYAWALHNRAEEMAKYAPEKNRFKGLFGVLRKGNAWVEDGYIDPVDEAINKSLEAKRKQLEKIKKQKEEAFNLDFEIWKESLEDSEWEKVKAKIKKETGRESGGMFDASLKMYFRKHIKQPK